jgi:hypothetical protein
MHVEVRTPESTLALTTSDTDDASGIDTEPEKRAGRCVTAARPLRRLQLKRNAEPEL